MLDDFVIDYCLLIIYNKQLLCVFVRNYLKIVTLSETKGLAWQKVDSSLHSE
jgi:hypothetical protein